MKERQVLSITWKQIANFIDSVNYVKLKNKIHVSHMKITSYTITITSF